MDSSRLLQLPLPWFLAAAVLVGAAASRLTRRSRAKRPDGSPDTTAKWVMVCVYLSGAVVCATIGLLAPTAREHLDSATLVACAVTAALAFPVFRFRKSVGVPVLVLAAALVVVCVLFLQSVVAFSGETQIATVKVISQSEGRMTLEIAPTGGPAEVAQLEGEYFAPVVKVIVFDDALVFLGGRSWYRFVGITAFRVEREGEVVRLRQTGSDHYLRRPAGIPESLYGLFEKWDNRIPGVKTVQVEMDLKRVQGTAGRDLATYSIRLQNDGGVEVVRAP